MSRERIMSAYRAALAAVDPERASRDAVSAFGDGGRVWIAALGKAAPGMVRGAADAVGERLVHYLAVSDHTEPVPPRGRLLIGGHPLPDESSGRAGSALLDFVTRIPPEDLLLVLVSGGGSALAEVPAPGLDIAAVAELTNRLMDAGTPINELNLVRRHLSQLKNGGLLDAAGARRVISLLISDVIDDHPAVISSGPTLADGSSFADAAQVIRARLGIDPPPSGAQVRATAHDHTFAVIADCETAARAAAAELGGSVWTTTLRGEASTQARQMVAARQGRVLVAAGETTVTMEDHGVGGRNQEAALAAAMALVGDHGYFAALGTDGIDGPTDAAGGIVDPGSADRMRTQGIDPDRALAIHDSYRALSASDDLVITGPSGTNVGDLWIALP